MEMITNTMKQFVEMQQKMVTDIINNNTSMPEFIKNTFGTYTDTINKTISANETTKQLYDNNIKFHKAFIAYHTAIVDMMTTVNENVEIIKKQTKTKK